MRRRLAGGGIAAALVALLLVAPTAQAKPKLSIADAKAIEGQALKFEVTLSKKARRTVRVSFAAMAGSASATDFSAAAGRIKIKKGKRRAGITIGSTEDAIDEVNERFTVELSNPRHAKLADDQADGTIVDDDQPPPPCTDGDADGVCVEDDPPDCNDQDATISPNETEVLDNGIDDDCDPSTSDGMSSTDDDADGFSVLAGDCHDHDPSIHPGAQELDNGIDDDCDGLVDEGN
jgi:hypothetical protein